MEGHLANRFEIRNLPQIWYRPATNNQESLADGLVYRPAALVECRLSFRSIRAGFQHTEELFYTAWYPTKFVTIDWATPAVKIENPTQLGGMPQAQAAYSAGEYDFSAEYFAQLEEELLDYLTRRARFSVFSNANYSLYSTPQESRDSFLGRVTEVALEQMEPALKRLLNRFELAIEQLREAQARRGQKLEGDEAEEIFTRWREVFATSENRLAEMFLGRFRMVLEPPEILRQVESHTDDRQLIEELRRIEREANAALNALYTEHIQQIEQCDTFEVGLQRDNIHVLQRGLLWVPTSASA